jgi:hypothetical protein
VQASDAQDTPGTRDIVNPVATDRLDLDMRIDEGKGRSCSTFRRARHGASIRAGALEWRARPAAFRDSEGDSYPVTVPLAA